MVNVGNLKQNVLGQRPVSIAMAVAAVIVLAIGLWAVFGPSDSGLSRLDVTLEELEANVVADPQNVSARLAVAIGYSARGYNDEAIAQFEEALKLEENNQTALIGIGRLHLEEGRTDEALDSLLLVAELNKDNPFKDTLEQLEAVYYDLGIIYTLREDYSTAASYLEQALVINAVDADAWYRLGETQRLAGELDAAVAAFHRASRLAPDYAEVYEGMAEIYREIGRPGEEQYAQGMLHLANQSFSKAIDSLSEAAETVPNLAEAHQGLGLALESEGRIPEALDSYQRALDLDDTLILARLAVQRLAAP